MCVRAHTCVSSIRALSEGSRGINVHLLHVPAKKDDTSTRRGRVARPSNCSSLAQFASVNHNPRRHLCKPGFSASREILSAIFRYLAFAKGKVKRDSLLRMYDVAKRSAKDP